MQGARYESGLDNSPMYDGEFFDTYTTHLMQLADVGMSSMVAQEAYALSKLAAAIGRPEGPMLKARGDALSAAIAKHLWMAHDGIFTNLFANGTFYPRRSPTSFYAMQAGAATDAQATTMMNSSHFCIAKGGDFKGNSDTCYWGLPSIEASDPAFPALGYWRGYVWGPQTMLTCWALQNDAYKGNAAVTTGRKVLCSQMKQLMLSQWNEHRHICENYNPHKTADTSKGDCSGSKFYHWGALNGLVGLIEQGYW